MSTSSMARAVIINLDQNDEQVECMFNPAEYTFKKENSWNAGGNVGRDLPQIEFSSGQPTTLQMQLFFDTYSGRPDVRSGGAQSSRKDVRIEYTEKIWKLMLVDQKLSDAKTGKARPPIVRFQWGKSWTFDAVITSITQRFSLFLEDGTPVRAILDVVFQQVRDTQQFRPQNPTSGGVGGERLWTVKAGDTLPWIAHKTLGNAGKWPLIAIANRLERVRRLAPGTILVIPND
jgi:predicted Zn-dependent protease